MILKKHFQKILHNITVAKLGSESTYFIDVYIGSHWQWHVCKMAV